MAEGRVPFCYLCVMFCPFANKVVNSFKNKIIFQSSRGRAENLLKFKKNIINRSLYLYFQSKNRIFKSDYCCERTPDFMIW